jgi:predicted permease
MASQLWNDLRFALRQLRRNPGFAAIAVVALALGIGANTAIFSVFNAVLLRPLPYRAPDRLVQIWERNEKLDVGIPLIPTSAANFADWRAQSTSFEGLGAFRYVGLALSGEATPTRIWGGAVSPGLLSVLGVSPLLGRTFLPDEERPGHDNVVLLGYDLWRRRYHQDPAVVNQQLMLDGHSYTIVGVMPAGFQFPLPSFFPILTRARAEVWVPYAIDPAASSRDNRQLGVIGRLRPGVTVEHARGEMATIATRLAAAYPARDQDFTTWLVPLHEQAVGGVRPLLSILLGAVGLILLIACANVANLQLARANARQRELAVRRAIGASSGQIVRQLLVESILLAVIAAVAGVGLAGWILQLLVSRLPASFPRGTEIGLDGRVLGFTLLLAILTGLAFGIAPALEAGRADLSEPLREGGRGATGGRGRRRVLRGFVISEIALALVLLVGAGLLVRSLVQLYRVNPGFDPEGLVTVGIELPRDRYTDPAAGAAFFHRLIAAIRSTPAASDVAASTLVPFDEDEEIDAFRIEGHSPETTTTRGPLARSRSVDGDYFHTLRLPVLQGRAFDERDDQSAPPVAVVNRMLAERYWPGQDAVGKRVTFGDSAGGPWTTIVGVVGNAVHSGLDVAPQPEIYTPVVQTPQFPAMTVLVRTGDPMGAVRAVRTALHDLDPSIPVAEVRTMRALIDQSLGQRRIAMLLLGLFALLALALASLGIYGVMAYSVAARTHEIGVRLALGATMGDVLRMVMGDGMRLAATGLAIGIVAAAGITRVLGSLLYGVRPLDAGTFGGVALLLGCVALAASWVPAGRAARSDPMRALRSE